MRRQSSDFCYGGTELLNGWACSHSSCDVEENKREVLMHGLLSQQIVGVSSRSRKKIPLGLQGREPLPYQASHESFSLVMEKLCSKPVPDNSFLHVLSKRRFWPSSIQCRNGRRHERNLITGNRAHVGFIFCPPRVNSVQA